MPDYYGIEVNGKALSHSKGPWKKHKYITKEGEGEGAKYTYAAEKSGVSSGRKKNVTGTGGEIGKTGGGLGTGKVGTTSSGGHPYVSDEYKEELAYNSKKNDFNLDGIGEYKPIGGVSASSNIDYAKKEQEMNNTLDAQNANGSKTEVKTQKPANVSQEYWDEMNYNSQVNTWDNVATWDNVKIGEKTYENIITEHVIVENIITQNATKPVSSLPQSSVDKGKTAVQKVGDFMKTAAKTVVSAVSKAAEKVGNFLGNLFGKKSK